MTELALPLIILALLAFATIKRAKPYDSFVKGANKAFAVIVRIFPYLTAVFIMTSLMEISGLNNAIIDLLTPFFSFLGIEKELVPLILLKPFSGSGSLSVLSEIMQKYGADSYIGRAAAVVFGSSETVFYVGAIYFSACKNKPTFLPFLISLVANFISTVFACFICRIV